MATHIVIRRVLALTVAATALSGVVVQTSGRALEKKDFLHIRTSTAAPSAGAAYLRLPLRFERAPGKTGGDAFVARGSGYGVWVSGMGASLLLKDQAGAASCLLTMAVVGANRHPRATVHRPLPGVSNYLMGSDSKQWVTGVRGYEQVEYRDVYRGVDIIYYGNQRRLEYDFVVAPGASPDVIALAFDGASRVSAGAEGDLVIATDGGNLVQHRPEIYQDDNGVRRPIRGGYVIRRDKTIGFRVGSYDRRRPLVIDPVLSYATYLGGVKQERGNGVAVDAAGNVIVVGETYSPDFPVVNPVQPGRPGDAFVVKLNPAGDAIVYATYFGGTQAEVARDVAVDVGGNAYVAGYTESWDFPATNTIGSAESRETAFVLKLDPAGGLVYATQIGGSAYDDAKGIAVDADGRAHIAGVTGSADFPVVNPSQQSLGGYPVFRTGDGGGTWTGLKSDLHVSGIDALAFDPLQPGTVYAGSVREGLFRTTDDGATWARASMPPQRVYATAVQDGTPPAVFAAGDYGLYRSTDHGDSWMIATPFQWVTAVAVTRGSASAVYAGMGWSADVMRSVDGGNTWIDTGLAGPVQLLAASGDTVYAVTMNGVFGSTGGAPWVAAGGTGRDVLYGNVTALAVDSVDANLVYAGTPNGLFKTSSGGAAWAPVVGLPPAWIGAVAIAPSDSSTVFIATSMGGVVTHDAGQTWSGTSLGDAQLAIVAFDPSSSAHVYVGCYMNADAFVATLSADGSRLEYSTFIGGTRSEAAKAIAVDSSGNRYITGDTFSEDFPTVHPIQSAFGGLWDSFVVKISSDGVPVYSTYLGGSATDYNARIAADAAGRAYVTGLTLSTNFPVVNAWQPVHGGGYTDVFVTALNESGSAFVYSTYLGGNAMENDPTQSLGPAIAVTPAGEVSVTGTTQSTNFPVTADAWHGWHAGGVNDMFVSRFDTAGTLRYSTFLGGQGADYGRAIAVDTTGGVIVAGYTNSADFATSAAAQPIYAGSDDAFVVKFSPEPAAPDTIAPTTTIALSGTPGVSGWYKSPVTVSLSSVDNEGGRGLAYIEYRLTGGVFQRYTGPFTVTQSGTTQMTVRAVDWAGNIESPAPTATVAIDTTGPIVSFQVTGTFGLAGWLKSPATVTVFAVDVLGTGVESVEYRIGDAAFQSYTAPFIVSAEGVTQVTARATDRNGNVSTSTRTVSIDTSAPRTGIAVSGTMGLAGWYKSAITVTLSGTDNTPGSGVGTIEYRLNEGPYQRYSAPFTLSTQGVTRITARTTDRAGNVEAAPPTTTVMIDSSAPKTTAVVSGVQGLAGWYLSPVAVSLAAVDNDPGSGVASIEFSVDEGAFQPYNAPISVAAQGWTRISARATDAAGNVETAPPTTIIRIDSTAPVVTITSPESRAYQHSDDLLVSFSAVDVSSGVQNVSAVLDGGAVQNAQTISLLTLALGAHTFEVSASDFAGNAVRQSMSLQVVATIDSLIAAVNIYAGQGKIDASNQRSLLAKLNDAKAALDRGNTSVAPAKLREFVDQCTAKSGRGIATDAAAVLAGDAQYVLATL